MTKKKIFFVLVLLVFLFSIPTSSYSPTVYQTSTSLSSVDNQIDPIPPTPEPPHRILPLRMLVYTEFVDVNREFPNTMQSINQTYGTDYYWTNLSDYNDLDTLLPGHDVLLIPEQEWAPDTATLETVGQAWTTTLTNFVQAGGIVILLSCYGPAAGATTAIYNESGLMQINNPSAFAGTTL